MPGGSSISYVRAIDGLRALALALVLLFHAEVPPFRGGFLGVSLFFTLSGYLITQLLLRERDRTGRIDLGGFWARRLRRLAPASLACLLVVALLVLVTSWFPGASVPGDVLAGALNVANWRFAFADASYQDLFVAGPSPVLHYWSLAIEEQFYLLFPLVVVLACGRRGRRRTGGRRRLAAMAAAGWFAGAVASVLAGTDLAYYGTHTRAPELLAGVLLALAIPIGHPITERTRRLVAAAGVAATASLLLLAITTTVASGWLYQGGLPAVSILWCALVASATVPGPLSRLLGWAPAVAVGRRSYGMYVYHWPVFLIAARVLPDWEAWLLVPVELAVTVALAWISYRWLEEPIRRGARLAHPAMARPALAFALSAVLIAAALMPAPDELRFGPTAGEELGVVAFRSDPVAPAVDIDVVVVGSEPSVVGALRQAQVPGARLVVRSEVRPGCPLQLPEAAAPGCPTHAATVADALAGGSPDVVVVAIGAAERSTLPPAPAEPIPIDWALQQFAAAGELVGALLSGLAGVPTLVIDTAAVNVPAAGASDPLATVLSSHALGRRDTIVADGSDPSTIARHIRSLAGITEDRRSRLMVIGDSTSFELAQALDHLAGSRYNVVWAGALNCPLVTVTEIRWHRNARFAREDCPTPGRQWPEVVAEFRPDVVLGVWSIPELAEQRYPGDDEWYEPGDDAYVLAHDTAMAALQELLAPVGALTLVATSPPFAEVPRGVADFGGGPLGEPDRLDAWTQQVARWDIAWRSVGQFPWARMVVDAEAVAGGSLRGDGLHFDPGTVDRWMAGVLVAELEAALDAVEADASAAGCLVDARPDRLLQLDRCRTPG